MKEEVIDGNIDCCCCTSTRISCSNSVCTVVGVLSRGATRFVPKFHRLLNDTQAIWKWLARMTMRLLAHRLLVGNSGSYNRLKSFGVKYMARMLNCKCN